VALDVEVTAKYPPGGVEVSGAVIWQPDRTKKRQAVKAKIHFEKTGLPLIKVSNWLINVQSHPQLLFFINFITTIYGYIPPISLLGNSEFHTCCSGASLKS